MSPVEEQEYWQQQGVKLHTFEITKGGQIVGTWGGGGPLKIF